jgi:hypothetical protein
MSTESTTAPTEATGGAKEVRKSRSFKVLLQGDEAAHGRYSGNSPYQAANKALSEIIRTRVRENKPVDEEIQFNLIETTKGSQKKSYTYVGKRIKLDTPVTYQVAGGQTIEKVYKNQLRKVKASALAASATA